MRILLASISFILAFNLTTYSQGGDKSGPTATGFPFTYVTNDRDTLYMTLHCKMSKLLFSCWETDPEWNGRNPVILFVERETLLEMHETNLPWRPNLTELK